MLLDANDVAGRTRRAREDAVGRRQCAAARRPARVRVHADAAAGAGRAALQVSRRGAGRREAGRSLADGQPGRGAGDERRPGRRHHHVQAHDRTVARQRRGARPAGRLLCAGRPQGRRGARTGARRATGAGRRAAEEGVGGGEEPVDRRRKDGDGQGPARGVQRRRHRHPDHDHGAGAEGAARRRSPADLLPLVPVLLSYVLSFVYLGIYWNNHHHLLQAVAPRGRPRAVGEPAPAVLALADPVHHRLDGREPLRRLAGGAVRRGAAAGGGRLLRPDARADGAARRGLGAGRRRSGATSRD